MDDKEADSMKPHSSRGHDNDRHTSQSAGWETMMRQQLPDFARIAIMVKSGVKGHIAVDTEQQEQDLAALVAELTGIFAKKINDGPITYELYWDEFIESQNPDPASVIAYLLAALDYREARLILRAKQVPALMAQVARVEDHYLVVLARKGERLPIGDQIYTIPEAHYGIAIFWQCQAMAPAIEEIVAAF